MACQDRVMSKMADPSAKRFRQDDLTQLRLRRMDAPEHTIPPSMKEFSDDILLRIVWQKSSVR